MSVNKCFRLDIKFSTIGLTLELDNWCKESDNKREIHTLLI